jgi:hypothetical protein
LSKGKIMLLYSIIDKISKEIKASALLLYFFY